MPYDLADPVDFFIVSARYEEHFGQFIFPKTILFDKGILSKDRMGGKRAFRIYPPWDITDSRQAKASQTWQLKYFLDIPANKIVDTNRILNLLACQPS